ncbi:cytidylyltransferase domain-containing protein [Robertmurraya massiliosenegalensis]|uniref:cytidylyltransferase domain-containing protein n=1 Tax=Robertmurraya massiliosenegalensis TaxID=1287657 RepID=UPI0002E572EB|nr:glycosyltransferase family protein [Robertmurraya massiliosenegalensis]
MKTIAIIQARMGSTRLPEKILKPVGNTDNLTYVTERCKRIQGVSEVIVATSTLSQDDAVEQWCIEHQIAYYRGSEVDVLDRFVQCAKPYSPDYILRVTADCPFVDYEMASEVVACMQEKQVDIVDLSDGLPRGLAVEMVSYQALTYIHEHGHETRHREHVTYYAYEFKEEFSRTTYQVPYNRQYPDLRITLDTEEDYALISKIGQHFNDVRVSSVDVINYLIEHPEVAKINAHIEQKPVV